MIGMVAAVVGREDDRQTDGRTEEEEEKRKEGEEEQGRGVGEKGGRPRWKMELAMEKTPGR